MTTETLPRGEIWDIDVDTYHADEPNTTSHSSLDKFIADPNQYWRLHVAKTDEFVVTPEMQYGTIFHAFLLEDREIWTRIPSDVLNKDGHKKGKQWTDFLEAHEGELLLKDDEITNLVKMRDGIMAHNKARLILNRADQLREQSIRWPHPSSIRLRCRIDIWADVVISDLKTTRLTTYERMASHVYDMGYHRQAAMYQDGVKSVTGEVLPFCLICVDRETHQVEVIEPDEEFLKLGREENDRALHRLQRYWERWGREIPWQRESYGEIVKVSPPTYVKKKSEWEYTTDESAS